MEAERVGFDTQALDVIAEVDEETKERGANGEECKSGFDDFVRNEIEGEVNIGAASNFPEHEIKSYSISYHRSANLVRDNNLISDNS